MQSTVYPDFDWGTETDLPLLVALSDQSASEGKLEEAAGILLHAYIVAAKAQADDYSPKRQKMIGRICDGLSELSVPVPSPQMAAGMNL